MKHPLCNYDDLKKTQIKYKKNQKIRIKQTDCRKPSELNHSDDGDDDGVDVASFKVGLQRPLQVQTVSGCWVK